MTYIETITPPWWGRVIKCVVNDCSCNGQPRQTVPSRHLSQFAWDSVQTGESELWMGRKIQVLFQQRSISGLKCFHRSDKTLSRQKRNQEIKLGKAEVVGKTLHRSKTIIYANSLERSGIEKAPILVIIFIIIWLALLQRLQWQPLSKHLWSTSSDLWPWSYLILTIIPGYCYCLFEINEAQTH